MTKHKIIHIIGGGYNQLPLVKVAHDLGLKVLITDSHENCPCRAEADIFERVDMTDKNATLKTAMAANIDAIVADQVDAAIPTAAYVAEHMGLKGIGYETALRFTNKFLMRESLRASLPEYVPEFHFFDKTQDAETFCGKVSSIGEYVVKPINSQGSKGVRRLNSTNCFEIISNAFLESNSRGILIEKFIKGFEYSVEAYKEGDIIYNLAVTKKYHYDSNDCIDARNTWLGDISPELERMLFDANKQIIEKLGLPFGITHAEFKVNEGKPYLIEIAARGGGGSISNKIIPYLTGFHPAKALFAHLIGLNQQITVEDYKEKYAVLKFFNFREGKINKIHINKSAVQDLLEFHLDIKEGGIVRPIWDSRDRPGYFVLTGTDRSQVITREKWIEESVAIEYEKK